MAKEDKAHSLVIAISSRVLFDLEESHQVFEQEGIEAYSQYQIEHENDILTPGIAFQVVKKLLAFNQLSPGNELVEVILLSRNSADTGLRIFNSIQHYGLDIIRAVFCSGRNPYQYIHAFGADLFLSTHAEDIQTALSNGLAAAHILSPSPFQQNSDKELRIAFDGDAVIFSAESDRIYKAKGLDAFFENEINSAKMPLSAGPFKEFLISLQRLQKQGAPIRTALMSARSAPAHERVIRTLRSWDIRLDEALFLGGKDKIEFLKAFGADLYFDDHVQHCELIAPHITTGFVPQGDAA